MFHGRNAVVAGLLIISAALTACGGGSSDAGTATSTSTGRESPADAFASTPAIAASLNPDSTAAQPASAIQAAQTIHTLNSTPVPASLPVPVVSQPQSLTLTWTAPDENADGTPLVNLAGYKIRYGTASGSYTETITLSNAGLNRYVIDNLSSGTYYFVISAYNSSGTESPLTGEVSTTL